MDFGHGKVAIDGVQTSLDHVDRSAARLFDHRDVEIALLVGLYLGFADRLQARRLQKAGDRVLRRADARAFFLFLDVGLARRDAVHRERKPARRDERLGALVDETGLDQPVGDQLAQILGRARLHACGDFFGQKFEQQVGHIGTAWMKCSRGPA